MKLVSIIIVNWNGKRFLKMCLPSLKKITYPDYEVIVVDNGSSDDSIEYLKKFQGWVRMVKNGRNLGFAQANNIGLKQSKGDYILLLNNDVEVEADFLDILVQKLGSSPQIAVVQPKICLYEKRKMLDSAGSFLTSSGFLYHFGRLKPASLLIYNEPREIFSAKGAAMLLRKDVLDKVGFFDSDFFAYFEETDLCHRIWLAGFRVVYEPRSVIYHVVSGTTLKLLSNDYVLWHSLKNRICAFLKNFGIISLLKITPFFLLIYATLFWYYVLTLKLSLAVAIMKAVFWNITNLPKTFRKRRFIQNKLRRVSDKTFLHRVVKNPRWSYYWYLLTDNLGSYPDI